MHRPNDCQSSLACIVFRDRPDVGFGGLAQLGERLPCKQEVSGSIPLISTTKKRLTEIPKEFEVSFSLLKKKLKHAP